jgi:integrase
VKHCRIFLRSILEEAAEQDFLRKNPARLRIPLLKPVTEFYLTIPQIQKLLKAAKPNLRNYMLLRLGLVTALRPSELFMLIWRCLAAQQKLLRTEETIYRGGSSQVHQDHDGRCYRAHDCVPSECHRSRTFALAYADEVP